MRASQEWQYNNMMYLTAAYLVAQKTGKNFTDYVEEHIFDALDMHSSTYRPFEPTHRRVSSSQQQRMSRGYHVLANKTAIDLAWTFPTDNEGVQVESGAGGVVSSTRDLVKWVEFLIRQRNATDAASDEQAKRSDQPAKRRNEVVSPESIRTMTSILTPQERMSSWPESSPVGYGAGFQMNWYKGVEFIKHGGSIPGFGSQIVWNSHLGIGAIALCNAMMCAFRPHFIALKPDKRSRHEQHRQLSE